LRRDKKNSSGISAQTPDQILEGKTTIHESAVTMATMPTISNKKNKKANQENIIGHKKVSYYFVFIFSREIQVFN
jgi:hypothetical protein